jgi:ABC-type amino acid transport substrate-binding protein
MPRTVRLGIVALVTVALMAAAAVALVGCSQPEEPAPQPKVSPPAIAEAGVLRAGVDLSRPPFAGEDGGQQAGIDIDVAAALAEKLGLTVEYDDVKPSEAATALADGTADVVFSVPLTGADVSRLTLAGTYLSDAPAAFVAAEGTPSVEPTLTLDTLPAEKIAVQTGSQAYWLIESEYGAESIEEFETLREALDALQKGEVGVAAGDAMIGAYIARDFPNVRFAGQLAPATPLSVAVSAENTALADTVREALDELAADNVLSSVRRKWVGDLPELSGPEAEEGSGQDAEAS